MQGTSSWSWGFNPLLLRVYREISHSLLCSHSSWVSGLVLVPPLCRSPSGICSCPDKRGLKQQLIRGLLLTHIRVKEGYGSHNWNVGLACSGRGQHDIATAWAAPCVFLEKLSLDHGTLAVAGCTGSLAGGRGVWEWRVASDLCLHTGLLVVAAAVLAFDAHLWCPSC